MIAGRLRLEDGRLHTEWEQLAPNKVVAPTARVLVGERLFSVEVLGRGKPITAGRLVAILAPREEPTAKRRARATDAAMRDTKKARDARWRDRNREKWRAYHRAKVARWRARHHDVARAIERRSDAKRRGKTS